MEVVDVDAVGAQVAERLLALIEDVAGLIGPRCGAVEMADLGGHHLAAGLHTKFAEGGGEPTLRLAVSVGIGVVPVIHPRVEPGLDSGEQLVFIRVGPADRRAVGHRPVGPAHGPAPEADF